MKGYKHLNLVQRSEISVLKASGKKQKDIAAYVGCSAATVSRELSRNKTKQEFTILKQLKNWLMSVRNALVESGFLIKRKNLLLFTLLRKITGQLNKS